MPEDLEEIRERKLESLKERAQEEETGGGSGDGSAASRAPIHIERAEHLDELVAATEVVLVDFYAEWCGPCQTLEPVVETIAAETDAAVAKVDVDSHQELAAQYQVRGVPTCILYANGDRRERFSGVKSEPELRALVQSYT